MGRKVIFLVPLVFFLATGFLGLGPSSHAIALQFGAPYRANVHHELLLKAAEERGFWKEQGLEVNWRSFPGGSAMMKATAAKSIVMATTAPMEIFVAVSRGVPVVVVADMKAPQKWYVAVVAESRIKKPADMVGAKIGTARMGGSGHAYVRAAFKALGMEKKVRIVGTGRPRATVASLRSGAIDAGIFTATSGALLRYQKKIRPVVILSDYFPQPWAHMVVYTRTDFARKSPEAVKKVLKALAKAGQFVMNNPNWAVPAMKVIAGYPEPLARWYFPQVKYGSDLTIDVKALKNVLNFILDYGLLPREQAPPLEKVYNLRFWKP